MLADSLNTVSIQRLDLRNSGRDLQDQDMDRTLEAFFYKAPHLIFSLLRPSTASLMYESVLEYIGLRAATDQSQISIGSICDASNLAELWSQDQLNFELVINLICESREPCEELNFSANRLDSQ